MKRFITCLTALTLTLMSFGCSGFGSVPAAASTTQTQLHATVAGVNAYCALAAPTDAEVQRVCATVQDAVSVSQPVVDLALNTLMAIFTKRAARARALLEFECHSP